LILEKSTSFLTAKRREDLDQIFPYIVSILWAGKELSKL